MIWTVYLMCIEWCPYVLCEHVRMSVLVYCVGTFSPAMNICEINIRLQAQYPYSSFINHLKCSTPRYSSVSDPSNTWHGSLGIHTSCLNASCCLHALIWMVILWRYVLQSLSRLLWLPAQWAGVMSQYKYSSAEIIEATDNFSPQAMIGEGSLGKVYRGKLVGMPVVIKKLCPESLQVRHLLLYDIDMHVLTWLCAFHAGAGFFS